MYVSCSVEKLHIHMHMTHYSCSTVWHECVSECVCTCDCDTHMCNSVEEHIIHNAYCLAPVVASVSEHMAASPKSSQVQIMVP